MFHRLFIIFFFITTYQRRLLKLMTEMKAEIQDVKKQLAGLNKHSVEVEELPEDISLPLTTMENLDELEQKLQNKHLQTVLVRNLSIFNLYVPNSNNICNVKCYFQFVCT